MEKNALSIGLTILFNLLILSVVAQTDSISPTDSVLVKPTKTVRKLVSESKPPVDSTLVLYFFETSDNLRKGNLYSVDTTIVSFHQYDPITRNYKMLATLSNIGTAHMSRVFSPPLSSGFLMHNLAFSNYLFTNKKIKYYKQTMPFSELWYVMGPKKEQNLEVTLSREIYKGFIFGLKVLMFNSPGLYLNSKTDDKSVCFTGQYYTKNKRYGVVANYLHNKLILQENGGITNDTIFTKNLETDRRVIPVQLSSAQNNVKEAGFYLEQYFNLLKPERKNDTNLRKIDAGHLSYAIRYQRNQMIFTDKKPLSDFYATYAPPLDSAQTFDSAAQILFRNQFKWSSLGYNEDKLSRFFHLYFGINYDHIEQTLPYDSVKTIYNEISPFGGININILKSSYLEAKGEMVIGGYNNGDFSLDARLTQYLGTTARNAGKFRFELQILNRTPAWYFTHYQSNRFRWNLNLNKESYLLLQGAYQYRNLEGGVRFYTLSDYTYFNDSVFPKQMTKAGTVMLVYVKGDLRLGKFGLNGKLVYQKASQTSIIHLPDFSGTMNFYYHTPAFHHAATFQGGFQLKYFTRYFADAYMPEMRTFYVQNQTEIGNYLFADAYLTLKIKRARIFVKANNFTGYFEGYNYFSSPHYPAQDPGFYLGVSWKFFN